MIDFLGFMILDKIFLLLTLPVSYHYINVIAQVNRHDRFYCLD